MKNDILKIIIEKIDILNKHFSSYQMITKDLIVNFLNINNSYTYINNFKFSSALYYSFSSFLLSYIIIFLPLNMFSTISGSIHMLVFFFKNILLLSLIALFYSIPIYFLKKEFLWKKIFLILLFASSLYFPLFSLTSLPMLFNQHDLHINFFLGGDNTLQFNPINTNTYFLLFTIIVSYINQLIASTIIPTIWLGRILNIKWWIILPIILIISILPAYILKNINPLILNFTHYISNIFGIVL